MNKVPIWSLYETFAYFPETGDLVARGKRRGPQKTTAGWVDTSTGYQCVRVSGVKLRSHIIAYAMHYGTYPPVGREIDHIDGDRGNNRIANLRCVTRLENSLNMETHRSGRLPGTAKMVERRGYRNRPWMARHQKKFLGYFATEQDAHEAFLRARGLA